MPLCNVHIHESVGFVDGKRKSQQGPHSQALLRTHPPTWSVRNIRMWPGVRASRGSHLRRPPLALSPPLLHSAAPSPAGPGLESDSSAAIVVIAASDAAASASPGPPAPAQIPLCFSNTRLK